MSSEAQDDEVIPATASMGYQKLTETDIESGASTGPPAKGGSISMTKGFLATLLTANTCCTSFAWIFLGAVLYVNGFEPRTAEFQPRLDPPSPPPLPPGNSSCTNYRPSSAVFEGLMHTMTADGLKEVKTEEGNLITEGYGASLGFSNPFAPTFFDFECLLANGTGDPCDAYVAEALANQMFDPLRIDSLVRLWLSTIFLYSLAQIGGIPRPRFIDHRIDWPGTVFWLSWMVTQLCQFFVVGLSLAMQIVAFFGVYERTGPCMVRVDNFTLLDEYAMVSFAAQPALLSKLLLLVVYGYLLSLGVLVFIGRNRSEVDFKAEASKTNTSLVQPIPLATVLYFISRWALYGICLGTVRGVGWIPSKPHPSHPTPWFVPWFVDVLYLISWWALYCLGTVGGWLGWPVVAWAAALVAASLGSLSGGMTGDGADLAKVALGGLLALPILPNLVYLPLGGLFLAFVKLSFAAGRRSLKLIDSTDGLNWARWKRAEALIKTAAAATKPAISWLAPLGSLELTNGMSMAVQGLAYTETSLSTLAGGLACVLGCLALSPLVAYGTWAAEQGRLDPDYDVENSVVEAVQARPWVLWLLAALTLVLPCCCESSSVLVKRYKIDLVCHIAFLLLLGIVILFTSQDDSYIERIIWHAQVVYGDSFAVLATLQLDVSGLQPFLDSVMADMVAFTGDPLGAALRVAECLGDIAADPLAPVREVVEAVANMSRYLDIDPSYFVEHSAALDALNVALGMLKLLATYGSKAFALCDVVLGLFSGEKEEGNEEDDGVVQVHECVADAKIAQLEAQSVWSDDSKTSLRLTDLAAGDVDLAADLWLKDNAVLTTLDLAGSGNMGNAGAKAIIEALRGNAVLNKLNISRNEIGPTGASAIADALKGSVLLKSLVLSGNNIRNEGATALADALRVNEVLTDLNLWDNKIGPEGAKALASALRVNGVLKTINLSGNSLGTEGWCAIFAALRDNKENKIESWDLSRQGINVEVAKVLAEYVSGSGVLTTLVLEGNDIGPEGAAAIAEALRGNAVLKSIDLRDNSLGTEGWCAIFAALRDNKKTKIESWDLSNQGINTEIAKMLEYVSGSEVLTTLVLRSNDIGPEGAKAIAEALRGNAALTHLDLYGNIFGDEGAKALASGLRVNKVLTDLNLGRNKIGDEGANALASGLRVNAVLKTLYLGGNNIGDEGTEALQGLNLELNLEGNDDATKALDLIGTAAWFASEVL